MIHTMLDTFFWICSDSTIFHLEMVKLMDVFKNNGYSELFWITNVEYKKK